MDCVDKGGGAVTVVYVDSVFVLNSVMDYLLLLCTGRLAGIRLRRGRYLLAALLGGGYAVAVFLPGGGFLAQTPVKLAAGALLALIAYGGEEKLLRLTLLLFAVSCAMAGCVLGLGLLSGGVPVVSGVFYTDVDARVLLIASAAGYAVMTVVFRAAAGHGVAGTLLPVRSCLHGETVDLTALLDTGNALRDPVGGQPVLVTAPGVLTAVLPPPARKLLDRRGLSSPSELMEPLREAAPDWRFQLVPYHAVGTAGGLLLAVRSDWTDIAGERHQRLLLALSPTALGNGYAALWGGEVRRGGHHERLYGGMAAAAGASGAAAGSGGPLHRRQRHPAAALDEGAGGGAAGAHRGGTGPAGADRA